MAKYHSGRNGTRVGNSRSMMPWLLGILAVLIIGGFALSMMGGMNADRTAEPAAQQRTTTGAATSDPTGANAPAKPRATDPTGASQTPPAKTQ
jgi:hypothetical protein